METINFFPISSYDHRGSENGSTSLIRKSFNDSFVNKINQMDLIEIKEVDEDEEIRTTEFTESVS